MEKRIISLLLAIMMVAGMLPTVAFAAEDTAPAEITGMSITVDGVTYDGSSATRENPAVINADSTVTLTINGTNLDKLSPQANIFYSTGSVVEICSIAGTTTPTQIIATMSAERFKTNGIPFELCYAHSYYDAYFQTGIHVVYDFRGEEAVINGMKLTVDGIEYTSGIALIRPESQVTLTVLGENLHNISNKNNNSTTIDFLNGEWVLSADGTEFSYTSDSSAYSNFNPARELLYCNDSAVGDEIGSGIFVYYGTQMPAQITGVSITVDGETYTEGEVIITPSSEVSFTVSGTDFANLDDEVNRLEYAMEIYDSVAPDYGWDIDADNGTATKDFTHLMADFSGCHNYPVRYTNTGSSFIWTDLYLTYDDSELNPDDLPDLDDPEDPDVPEDYTLEIGYNTIFDGETYTYTAEQGGTLYITVTELGCELDTVVPESELGSWVNVEINGTAISEFENSVEVSEGDPVTISMVSLDEDSYYGTVNLSWTVPEDEGTDSAEPDGNIRIEMSDDWGGWNGAGIEIYKDGALVETVALQTGTSGTAELDFYNDASYAFKWIARDYDSECAFVIYVNDEQVFAVDGVDYEDGKTFLIYENGEAIEPDPSIDIPNSDGKILIDMDAVDGGGWDDSAIEIYKNGAWELTATVDIGTSAIAELEFDSTASYEFKWVADSYSYLCSFVIYADGEKVFEIDGVDYTDGHTFLIYKNGEWTVLADLTLEIGNNTVSVGNTYTYTAENKGVLQIGITELYTPEGVLIDEENLAEYGKILINGTAISEFENSVEVSEGDTVTISLESEQGESFFGKVTLDMTVVPDSDGKIAVVMEETYGDAWNGAAIEIYKNGELALTASIEEDDIYTEIAELEFDSTASYEFKWVKGIYDSECSFAIYVDGETVMEHGVGEVEFESGETILTLEPDSQPEDTTPAEITDISITVDGVTYTEGNVTIKPDSTISVTVTGINFENLSEHNWLCYADGYGVSVAETNSWIIDAAAGTATRDITNRIYVLENCNNFEVMYSNDGQSTWVGTGIYLTYVEPTPLTITKQPESASVKLGELSDITVEASGDGLTYKWFYRNVGDTKWNVSAFTTNTYAITMTVERAARELYCEISDEHGNTVNTEIVQMIGVPNQELRIITQPNNVEAYLGENYCSTVVAQGDSLQYQWYYRDTGSEKWIKSAEKDETYNYGLMNKNKNGREVYCVITDVWGDSVETEVAIITAIARDELKIISQPKDAEAHLGETYCITVIAQGEGLTYQWYYRNAGATKFVKSSIRDNTYDFGLMTAERHNREVYCVITDVWGNTVTSDVAKIVGIPSKAPEAQLKIIDQPQNAEAGLGESYCITVVAQGEGLTYQWYYRNAGSEAWIESTVRDNTYNYGLMTKERNGREVYCVITDVWGNTVTTDIAKIIGIPKVELKIIEQPQNTETKMGQRYRVDVVAQGEGLTYQWYYRNAGTETWIKSAIQDSSYDYGLMTNSRAGREVYCVITDAWGNTVTTEIVTLTITPAQS